ncbi:hypothetical protein K435DRAFT_776648, partial [Dendrothele bispora CBS 962.96]
MADRLPPELIIEIVHYLPLTDATLGVLTQVCSTWRRVIASEPKLWRKLILSPRVNWDRCVRPSQSHIEFGQQWLQRAGPCGLEIFIDDSAIRETRTRTPRPYNLLDVIMPFYKQWQALQLSLHFDCYKPLFDMVGSELTMLEEVSLEFPWRYGDVIQLEQQLIKTFDAAPRLKHVQLVSNSKHSLPLSLPDRILFPYQRLTTLVLEYVSDANPSVLTQILAVATNLECARFGLGYQGAWDRDYEDLTADEWERRYELHCSTRSFASCSKLMDLEIISQGVIEADFVLEVLTAPALQELRLYHHFALKLSNALETFQKRSKAPLRLLHLHYYDDDEAGTDLVPFLELVGETLQELVYDVHDSTFDQRVLETMEMITFPHDTGDSTRAGKSYDPLLPNLKRLGVALHFCYPEFARAFGRAVASRGYADVSPCCWLKDWLKEHRLEEVMLYCDWFEHHASENVTVRELKRQLRSFEEREVDALQMTWCGKGWGRESPPKWLPCEAGTNRTFSFDNR